MRRHGIDEPYEKLKAMTRGQSLTQQAINQMIAQLDLPATVKQEILDMTPAGYVGAAESLTHRILEE